MIIIGTHKISLMFNIRYKLAYKNCFARKESVKANGIKIRSFYSQDMNACLPDS